MTWGVVFLGGFTVISLVVVVLDFMKKRVPVWLDIAGVVFGVRGSLERVTPRVFLLSPAQVNIKVEEPTKPASAHDLFAD